MAGADIHSSADTPAWVWSDTPVRAAVDSVPEPVGVAFGVVSHLGSVWFVVPAVLAAFLLVRTERATAWLGIVGGGYGVMLAVKSLFSVERPDVAPPVAADTLHPVLRVVYEPSVEIATTAFPSGHVLAATVLWGLFVVDSRRCSRLGRGVLAGGAIVLVGSSRIALGVHYPIDVVAGVAVGGAYLLAVLAVLDRVTNPTTVALAVGSAAAWLGAIRSPELDAALLCGCLFGALLAWQIVAGVGQRRTLAVLVPVGVGSLAPVTGAIGVLAAVAGVVLGTTIVAVPLLYFGPEQTQTTAARLDRL